MPHLRRFDILFSKKQTLASWRKVWYVAMALTFFDATFFAVFGSGNEQYWNKLYVDDSSSPSDTSIPGKEMSQKIPPLYQDGDNVIQSKDEKFQSTMLNIPRAKLK